MRNAVVCCCTCFVTAASAGGLDQSGQPVTLLFSDGNVAEVAIAAWNPSVESSGSTPASGNVYGPITDGFAGVKWDVAPRISAAVIADIPYGVNVDYPDGAFPFAGTEAQPSSLALTGLLRWRASDSVAFHGGIRAERIGAEVALGGAAYGPFDGYRWTGDDDWSAGWVVGASWEHRDRAQRIALTYASEIHHELDSTETFFGDSTTDVTMPQSVNLDFQTGLTPRTLLYGSVRWVDWKGWTVAPPGLDAVAGPLIEFESDAWTWRLGIGRQLTDAMSAAVIVTHETAVDTMMSPLSPYDGFTALSLGSSYALPSGATLSGSVSWSALGEAQVATPLYPEPTTFDDNHAVAAQLRLAIPF